MSSRALRKLQREQEEQERLAKSQEAQDKSSEDDDQIRDAVGPVAKRLNAFSMLDAAGKDEEADVDETDETETRNADDGVDGGGAATSNQQLERDVSAERSGKVQTTVRAKKKPKKKKQRGKDAGNVGRNEKLPAQGNSNLDEIDLAINSLKSRVGSSENPEKAPELNLGFGRFYQLLATDSRHLNALNEMKKLFGNVVLEGDNEAAVAPGRRRGRGQQQLDLGGALAGRNSPLSRGQGLAGLALRRNVFMLGKEEWPKAGSGGLGMELLEKAWDSTSEYRMVHSPGYRDVQKQFRACVESLDPQRLIELLTFNPYHISTLLQVSEIAKQQGDHSVSGDLLERALFSFGRSVHSSFHTALSEGKARLDFRRVENRELWLVIWRYIANLGQRGTWRTAYEWAKLLLSLDPEDDPYGIHLILDQLAIRGGQFQQFIELANIDTSIINWGQDSPNIRISLGLAHFRLKQAEKSREVLKLAVQQYPWIFTRLVQELNIGHTPKFLWGKEPRTPWDRLQAESYVVRAKDLWNTPDAVSLLVEVTESVSDASQTLSSDIDISFNEARHILLSDTRGLISFIPRTYTRLRSTASDPYPPIDSFDSYLDIVPPESPSLEAVHQEPESAPLPADETAEPQGLESWFRSIFARVGLRVNNRNTTNPTDESAELQPSNAEFDQVLEGDGIGVRAIHEPLPNRLATPSMPDNGTLRQRLVWNAVNEGRVDSGVFERESDAFDDLLNNSPPEDSVLGEILEIEFQVMLNRHGGGTEDGIPLQHPVDVNNPSEELSEDSDDETDGNLPNQRWLVGQGLLALKEFVDQHGADENVWMQDERIDAKPVMEYARRVTMLQQQGRQTFILNHLSQRAGGETRDLIQRFANIRAERN